MFFDMWCQRKVLRINFRDQKPPTRLFVVRHAVPPTPEIKQTIQQCKQYIIHACLCCSTQRPYILIKARWLRSDVELDQKCADCRSAPKNLFGSAD